MCILSILPIPLYTILCSVSILFAILFELVLMSGYEFVLTFVICVRCRLSFSFVSLSP
jgi:hypothetical protein